MNGSRGYDPLASLALALVASIALAMAWVLPWWTMEARAPQYGQRTLVVEVSPVRVGGDIFEVDTLGHYVGIRKMGELASTERVLAPFGLACAVLGLMLAPWLSRRWMRALGVLPAVIVPVFFVFDLGYWMDRATNERDPDAALNLTVTSIQTKTFGEYEIAQFKVTAKLGGGLYLAGVAGLLGLGLLAAAPLPSPLSRRRRSAAAAAAAAALLSWASPAEAAEQRLGPEDSIAEALARSGPGDILRLAPGVHHERVRIEHSLQLIAEPGAVLDGDGQGTVLIIAAPEVLVSGLRVTNSGSSYEREDSGIRLERSTRVRLQGVRVEDTLFGIFALEADQCLIERSFIRGLDLPIERRGDGIRLWHSSGCRLIANQVERSRDVIIWYSSGTVAEGNTVRSSRYGLHYMYSDDNRFHHNLFEDNQVGAAIMYSRGIELEENAFSYSHGPAAYGLLLKDADDVRVHGNRFVGNTTGLFFDNAPQAKDGWLEVRANLIARNDVGIALEPNVRRVRFSENALVGNRSQVEVMGTGSAEGNSWSVDGRGNYWSDAAVYDPDGDGVSALPVRQESTYEVLSDIHPVVGFYAGTPAAEAIDLAARLFPIFQPRPKLVDQHPLVQAPLSDWTGSAGERAPGSALAALGGALLGAGALAWRYGKSEVRS